MEQNNPPGGSEPNHPMKNEPLNGRQQWCAFGLAGFLVCLILGSGIGLLLWLPEPDQLSWPLSFEVLRWGGLGGLLGGAARALSILKADLTGRAHDHPKPQWYLDRWPIYLTKPFLGVAGGLASYLAARLAFADSFSDPQVGLVRTLATALAGGIFTEDAFSKLQPVATVEWRPEKPNLGAKDR